MTDKRRRQRKVKGRAAIGVIPYPEMSPMGLDDGATDGESHPQTISLGRVERLKNFLGFFSAHTGASVTHGHAQ